MDARAYNRQLSDVARHARRGLDTMEARKQLLSKLRMALTVDAAFFATVDPQTMLFTSAVSEAPLIKVAARFLANELAATDVNRFSVLAAARQPVATLDRATRGKRGSSERYVTIMRDLSLGDELRVALRTGTTCWGVLCLHREAARSGFDDHDVALVSAAAPQIAEALRRAAMFGQAALQADRGPADAGVILLDADGTVVSFNDAAEQWLAEIGEACWPSSAELPLPVLAAAASLDHAGHAGHAPTVRVLTARQRWLSIEASRLRGHPSAATAVFLQPATPSMVTSVVLDAYGVTGAQARVVGLVLRGFSTQQIVNELHISAYTVQEHLTAVFDKLGVHSRRQLAATLLGDKPR